MTEQTNNERLRELRRELRLTRREIATMTETTQSAVDTWLAAPDSPGYRLMRQPYMSLVEFHIGERQPLFANRKRVATAAH